MNRKHKCLKYAAWPVLAIACVPLLMVALVMALFIVPAAGKGMLCAIAPLAIPKGKALSDEDFQSTLFGGVNSLIEEQGQFKTAQQKLLDDLGRTDKEVKAALEDLTKVKNTTNSSFEDVMKRMEKVQRAIALNAKSSFRDPLQRALANEETKFFLNAAARYVMAVRDNSLGQLDDAYKKAIDDYRPKAKALTGVDAGLGQATVPTDTFNEIYDLLLEYGDYVSLGVQRVGARLNVIPIATTRPQFYWIGAQSALAEGSTITSGAFGGSQVLSVINTCAVLMYIARELLQDSTVDLAPYVLQQMIESANWGLDTAAFIGNGNQDTTNAGYVGIFNAAMANANLAVSAGAGRTTVATMKLDDFVACTQTVSPQVLNRKPMWWAHTQLLYKMLLIRDSVGRPIFQTWNERPDIAGVLSLLGRPVRPVAVAPTTDGAAQPIITFGDPQGQAVHIREDLELATSDDIGFPQNLRAFRALVRAGVKMKTQAGSTTLKPFAVLSTAAA